MPAASSTAASSAACAGEASCRALDALAERAPSPIARLRLWRGLRGSAGAVDADRRTLAAARQRRRHGDAHQGPGDASSPRSTGSAFPIQRPSREPPAQRARAGSPRSRRRRRQSYRAEPAGDEQAADRLFPASGSRAAPSRRCSSAMAAIARVLGFSEQWTAPSPRSPFRYGGAVRPASLPADVARRMASAVIGGRPRLRDQGPRLRRFPGEGRRSAAARNQPAPRRHARDFRLRRNAAASPPPRALCKRPSCRPAGLKFEDAMASAIVYAPCPASRCRPAWSGPHGRRTGLSQRNGSTKTVRYALCGPARGTRAQAKRLVEERICKILAVVSKR